jgi:hypothetical protein
VAATEVIMNLWCIYDQQDKLIYGLAGRAYYVTGTDEEKTSLLKALALTDYVLARRLPVPERFTAELNGELVGGLCSLNELNNPATTLFAEMYDELQQEIDSKYNGSRNEEAPDESLIIPSNPLYLVTALVEEDDGTLKALMVG